MLFIEYPKCSTCKKAKMFLDEHNMKYEHRNIKDNPPTKEELEKYLALSKLDINKFFNTSGLVYKELNLKEKLNDLSLSSKLDLLSSNGMLIKRPILVGEDFVLIGFKINEWEEKLCQN